MIQLSLSIISDCLESSDLFTLGLSALKERDRLKGYQALIGSTETISIRKNIAEFSFWTGWHLQGMRCVEIKRPDLLIDQVQQGNGTSHLVQAEDHKKNEKYAIALLLIVSPEVIQQVHPQDRLSAFRTLISSQAIRALATSSRTDYASKNSGLVLAGLRSIPNQDRLEAYEAVLKSEFMQYLAYKNQQHDYISVAYQGIQNLPDNEKLAGLRLFFSSESTSELTRHC